MGIGDDLVVDVEAWGRHCGKVASGSSRFRVRVTGDLEFGKRLDLGCVERVDDVGNHVGGLLGEEEIVDAERAVEPLNLLLDDILGDEALLVEEIDDRFLLGVTARELERVVVRDRRDRERGDVWKLGWNWETVHGS